MSRRRRRGAAPPEYPAESLYPTLDLHGHTAEEAERTAERWLLDQQRAGEGVVRLITGRGLHSVGPPVLQPAIHGLLVRLAGSIVRSHQQESGGGAFRVQLLRPKSDARPRPKGAGEPIDPALALEAHQSLADLGIEPTDALVRLEMERIVKKRRSEAE